MFNVLKYRTTYKLWTLPIDTLHLFNGRIPYFNFANKDETDITFTSGLDQYNNSNKNMDNEEQIFIAVSPIQKKLEN